MISCRRRGKADVAKDRKAAGATLRDKRTSLNLSLSEVAHVTMLRTSVLESLESGGPVEVNGFTRSYARRYAEFLGLDGDEIVAPFLDSVAAEKPEEDRDASLQKARGRMEARAFSKKRSVVPMAVLVVVTLVGATLLLSRPWATEPSTPSNDVISPSSPVSDQPNTVTEMPSDVVSPDKPAATGFVTLKFVATTRRAWLEIISDSRVVFSGTLSPGDAATAAGRYIVVNFGNAMYTHVWVNGDDRGMVSVDQTVVSAEYGTPPETP